MLISIILPAYQEADNLRVILPEINRLSEAEGLDKEVLVIDALLDVDDGTRDVCAQNGAKYLVREGGNNYGDAIRTGLKHAAGEYIAIMDADGSHQPADLLRLIEAKRAGDCDVVIGSRYVKGGKTQNNLILRAMSRTVNIAYQMFFHLNVKDISNSFRVYDAQKLKSVPLRCDNFDVVEEILVLLKEKYPSLSIVEIPITFDKRMAGESKRDLVAFVFSYIKTIARLLKIRAEAKNQL